MRIGAVQLESVLGDIEANLDMCEQLTLDAVSQGAEAVILPEFFSTGMGFSPALNGRAAPPDGAPAQLLRSLAAAHAITLGGSFLCRDPDGHVRNAFMLATPDGIVGRHNRDVPTGWENCWYIGGADDGLLRVGDLNLGVALCLEFGRTRTVRRLAGADLVLGGSFTWHMPDYFPRWLGRSRLDRNLFEEMSLWAAPFARMVGAPVVESTHCGRVVCDDPLLPLRYRCAIGVGATICAADGTILAARHPDEGPGVIVADVEIGAVPPLDPVPARAWIRRRGLIGWTMWHAHRRHGYRYYQHQGRPQ